MPMTRSRSSEAEQGTQRKQPAARGDDAHVPANQAWAATIKSHHVYLREEMDKRAAARAAEQRATAADADGSAPSDAADWEVLKTDATRLDTYADAMHALATQHWDPAAAADARGDPHRRYNDRLGYIVGAVRRFFAGATDDDRKCGYEPAPPGIVAGALKAERRRWFAEHQATMAQSDADAFTSVWAADALGAAPPQSQLVVIDVGSCYNPLPWRFEREAIALPDTLAGGGQSAALVPRVLGLDLAPYSRATDVLRCDWATVRFAPSRPAAEPYWMSAEAATERDEPWYDGTVVAAQSDAAVGGRPGVVALHREAAHVVTMCLLLSYMPRPAMRAVCIANAHRALKPHGLLVVVSTRTQGSRRAEWVDEWVRAIEAVGFRRVDKNVLVKLVGLTFQKTTAEPQPLTDAQVALLRVIADDV